MKQGQTTLTTHPATLPLVEVGNNDGGVIVRFGRVGARLTDEPGGTGNRMGRHARIQENHEYE